MSDKASIFLNADDILNIDDRQFETVEVPEWGGAVRVRGLTGRERDQFEESILGTRDKKGNSRLQLKNTRARLVAMAVVDENGQRLFNRSDINKLGKKSSVALNRIYEVALRLSGISEEDQAELEGNSNGAAGDDSYFD